MQGRHERVQGRAGVGIWAMHEMLGRKGKGSSVLQQRDGPCTRHAGPSMCTQAGAMHGIIKGVPASCRATSACRSNRAFICMCMAGCGGTTVGQRVHRMVTSQNPTATIQRHVPLIRLSPQPFGTRHTPTPKEAHQLLLVLKLPLLRLQRQDRPVRVGNGRPERFGSTRLRVRENGQDKTQAGGQGATHGPENTTSSMRFAQLCRAPQLLFRMANRFKEHAATCIAHITEPTNPNLPHLTLSWSF